MIASTSSGPRFAKLARYLVHGRSGKESERVAWTASRNLGTDDPELAAELMQATAHESVRVRSPVYHLTISFDHSDSVDRAMMERVADRILSELGLAEHQAVLVAHRDRAHPHVHLMVNRTHPETGVAWERWQDRPRIERVLRQEERALGLREVPGRLHQLEGQELPERTLLTSGERRQAARTGEVAFPERVQEHIAEYRAARSWEELAQRLKTHSLRIERKGQGLVITDGQHQVKASRIGRDLSLKRLEARFGMPYPGHEGPHVPHRLQEPPAPAVTELAGAVREYEHISNLNEERLRLRLEIGSARSRLRELDDAIGRAVHATTSFRETLERVYQNPGAAHQNFQEAAKRLGADQALTQLRAEPERFGALLTVERRQAFGLVIATDSTQARDAARLAESLGRTAAAATERVYALVGAREAESQALARKKVEDIISGVEERRRAIEQTITSAPSLRLLEQSIARTMNYLEPRELTQLRRLVTQPQATLAFKLAETMRDVVLGREERG